MRAVVALGKASFKLSSSRLKLRFFTNSTLLEPRSPVKWKSKPNNPKLVKSAIHKSILPGHNFSQQKSHPLPRKLVLFSPLTNQVIRGVGVRFQSFLQEAVVSSSGMVKDVHSLTSFIRISSVNHGFTHPLRCSDRWLRRGCHGMQDAPTIQVSP